MQEHQTCLTHMPHLASCSLNDLLKNPTRLWCVPGVACGLSLSISPFCARASTEHTKHTVQTSLQNVTEEHCVYVASESPSVARQRTCLIYQAFTHWETQVLRKMIRIFQCKHDRVWYKGHSYRLARERSCCCLWAGLSVGPWWLWEVSDVGAVGETDRERDSPRVL